MRDDVAYVEFERTAPTLRKAIETAIDQIEGAHAGLRVVRVESEAANTVAKINSQLAGVE